MSSGAFDRFRKNRAARWGLAGVALLLAASLFSIFLGGRVLARPGETNLSARLEPPSAAHWLGTDDLGRDVLSRLVAGAPVSLSIGLLSAALSLFLGLTIGGIAGFAGGWTDLILSRVMEIVLCFPAIFLILALVAVLSPSAGTIIVAIGLTSWPNEARYARAEILKARELDYTRAATAAGCGPIRIFFRHLLPAALPPVLVSATFGVAGAILAESSLSFLGLGVPPSQPSWGAMLALSQSAGGEAWWLALFPGLAIFLTVASYNLAGEGWREALDPRLSIFPGGVFRAGRPN